MSFLIDRSPTACTFFKELFFDDQLANVAFQSFRCPFHIDPFFVDRVLSDKQAFGVLDQLAFPGGDLLDAEQAPYSTGALQAAGKIQVPVVVPGFDGRLGVIHGFAGDVPVVVAVAGSRIEGPCVVRPEEFFADGASAEAVEDVFDLAGAVDRVHRLGLDHAIMRFSKFQK
ncbi:MAG: hypothetical protein ACI9TH_002261 [Kiritimatiellia bacterium]|jgi:hypothetical protein